MHTVKPIHRINGYRSMIVIMSMVLYAMVYAEQKTGTLTGEVVDIYTGKPVPNAVVCVGALQKSDTTNETGRFVFDRIPVEYYDIDIRAQGYVPQIVPSVSVKSGYNKMLRVLVKKDEKVVTLDKMVVSAHRLTNKRTDQSNSVTRLSRAEVLNSPGATQDVNKSIQILPSVMGEISPGWNMFLVRGGQDEENIFLIDGIEVYNLSHWGTEFSSGGAISYLHPDFIESIDFYAGGMPARFPPRLSSVMDISFRNGSMTERTRQIDMNMAGVGVFLEGPFAPGRASYILNGRVSFLDILEPIINAGGLPKYQNGQTKLVWDVNANNSLSLNLLAGHETIDIQEDEGDDHVEDEGIHVTGGLRWLHRNAWGSNDLLFSGKYNNFTESGVRQDSITYWRWNNEHTVFQLKDDVSLFFRERDMANFGVVAEGKQQTDWLGNDAYYIFADLAQDSSYKYFIHAPDSTTFVPIDTVELSDYDTTLLGYRIGAHAGYTLGLNRVTVQAGIRNDYYTINKKHGVSPRAAVTVDMKRAGEISLSTGLYYQFPGYVTRLVSYDDYFKLPLQRNVQVVLGYSKQLSDVVLFGTEAYFKYYDQEPLYRIVVPDPAYPSAGYREVDASKNTMGKKRAYGIEFFVHKKKLDYFFYQVSYALFSSKREYSNGKWYNDDHNFRNSGKLIIGSNINKSNRVSLRLDVSEGNPYTPINETASLQGYDSRYTVSDGWNSKRRDPRVRLSFRYDLTFYMKRASMTAYVEVENILNQRDIVAEYYSLGDAYPQGEIKNFIGRGIFPIGGVTVTF